MSPLTNRNLFAVIILTVLFAFPPMAARGENPVQQLKNKGDAAADFQLTHLARTAVEEYIRTGKTIIPPGGLSEILRRPGAAFVTITKNGQVVGCMGSLYPREEDLACQVIRASITAATSDPWHRPVEIKDLPRLKYTVSVVGPLRRIQSRNQINTAALGLYVRRGNKGAVLLPGEALTADWALFRCREKAGIPQNQTVEMFVFETATFGPR